MNNFLRIFKVAWPVCFGYLPLGLACGVFAQKAGMNVFEVAAFCLLVYAGSGQFISIAMMMQASSVISIALTVFIVNLRHFLFSSMLLKFLKDKSTWFHAVYAHEITDESFAVNLTAFEKGGWTPDDAIKLNFLSHMTWTLSNIIGCLGGEFIAIDTALVGYALTAMFIGLWSFYLSRKSMVLAGVLAGAASVVFSFFIGYKMHVVLSAILVSAVFAFYETRYRKEAA